MTTRRITVRPTSHPKKYSHPIEAGYASQVILYEPKLNLSGSIDFTLFPFAQPFINISAEASFTFNEPDIETNCYLCGHLSTPFRLNMPINRTAVIMWHPLAFGLLCRQNSESFSQQPFCLTQIDKKLSENLTSAISVGSPSEALKKIVEVVELRFNRNWQPEERVNLSWNEIIKTQGASTNTELCLLSGLSERRLQQLFKRETGVSPKTTRRIVRFQNFLQSLAANYFKEGNKSGFYDDPHFVKELKSQTGMTPQHFATYLKQHATADDIGSASPF